MPTPASVALAYLAMSTLWTANDPFVGKWKLDVSRTKVVDQMRVEPAGPNTYAFRFEGGPTETIVADGTDQPGLQGTTLSATIVDSRTWTIVRKQGGQTIITAHWTLSADARTLRDNFTGAQADGAMATTDYLYRRTSGSGGVTGTWESTDVIPLSYELQIRAVGDHQLSFGLPTAAAAKSVTFDGKDHAVPGPVGSASASGWRSAERVLEMTDRIGGKVVDTRTYRLSGDGRTMTLTLRKTDETRANVLVFERQ
jgi:hypothetical protein